MVWLFRTALFAVVLTTVVSWGKSGVAGDPVTLWIEAPARFAPLASQQLEHELEAIVGPAGLQLEWRRLPNQAGAAVDGVSIVVRFRGACAPGFNARRQRPAAGWTHVSDGAILPFVEIDCDQVWSVIEPEIENEPLLQREFYLGRALGRVLAHELRHVLAQTAGHESTGLTKARLDGRDLITGEYLLTDAELKPSPPITDSSLEITSVRPAASQPSHASPVSGWSAHSGSAAAGGAGKQSLVPDESLPTGR
jgi:hypothetical protein